MPEEIGQKQKLTRQQKWGLTGIILLGVFVLIFSFWQFWYRVNSPFFGRGGGLKTFKSLEQQEAERLVAKQKRDTDKDGLTDFEEEYIYQTSPYLDDTDSDSFKDKEEIDSGNDPNCPTGKTCGLPELELGSAATSGAESGISGLGGLGGMGTGELAGMQTLLGGQATPETVRAALKQSGVSEEMLNKIDDKTLMELYQEVLKETGASQSLQNLNVNSSPSAFPTGLGALGANNFTPTQVRELLLQAGMDAAMLQGIDDEMLMKIFQESMR